MVMQYGTMVWGTLPLNPNVTITLGINDKFSFEVDGAPYQIILDQGVYLTSKEHFTSELIVEINKQLTSIAAPVKARLGGLCLDLHRNVLVLEHNDKTNNHTIDHLGGTAMNTILGEIHMTSPPYSQ